MPKPLEPVDYDRCQADVPGPGPFVMGGDTGDPKNGWRIRCPNRAIFIAAEKKKGADGRIGSMSLCIRCKPKLIELLGEDFAYITPIPE